MPVQDLPDLAFVQALQPGHDGDRAEAVVDTQYRILIDRFLACLLQGACAFQERLAATPADTELTGTLVQVLELPVPGHQALHLDVRYSRSRCGSEPTSCVW